MAEKEMKKEEKLLKNMPVVFFSSVTQQGIPELVDTMWKSLNS